MYRDLLAEQRNTIVGIDLGTTTSLIAIATECSTRVIHSPEGESALPSVAGVDAKGQLVIGRKAREQRVMRAGNTVYSIKRFMGSDAREAETRQHEVAYQLVPSDPRVASVKLGDKVYSAPEVSALYLKELKRWAELDLGKPVTKAVITVPAYFNDAQRQATRDAGRLAGLDVLRIVNEPTAAALAYGLQQKQEGYVAVYDLGGGTFDISILRITDGVFEVLATGGDTHLGGDDIDRKVAEELYRLSDFEGDFVDAAPQIKQGFIRAAEDAKMALSERAECDVSVKRDGQGAWKSRLTRERLESWARPIVERTVTICRDVLKQSGVSISKLDEVLLVGGSSRMPLVQRLVAEIFGRTPRCDINPEEVVALGAAVQARILAGGLNHMLLLDVTPLSLGVETWGGAYDIIIARNTTIPVRATQEFTTNVDGQTKVSIHVLQGERELAKDNRSLARFVLTGIPPMPAGAPRIEITYELDANGILNVTAVEQRSGTKASIEVTPSSGLSDDDVQRMIRESFVNAGDDLRTRMLLERRGEAERILKAVDKALEQSGESIDAEYRREIEATRANLSKVIASDDVEALKRALADINRVTQRLAEIQMNAVLASTVQGRKVEDVGAGRIGL
ncbi:MAG: Fe-S protein assembly chaperone HscA [Planctomycetaceae bacterium]|nr:Fe-S protein assembly chaperone HscA [Planctomycetaceae bacterium]